MRRPIELLESRQMLSVNVTSWHNDAALTGQNNNETILTPANVNSASFGELFTYPIVGQVYAQPLYVSNLNIPGQGVHNVIFVATQDNDVYALDANSDTGANAGVLWHVNLGPAAAMPNNYFGNKYGPYHDINPQVGITGTPVIDLSTDTLYVDAFTNDVPGQNVYSHHIHALSLFTGQDKVTPMLVQASVNGTGVGGNGTTVTFSAEQQLQRPALELLNGVLYVCYGGFADSDPYHGWVLGFNPSTLALVSVFNDTPNLLPTPTDDPAGESGIWMGGAGLASDGTNLIFMSGNGDFTAAVGDYGDSVVKITPDTSTAANPNINGYGLHVNDYFTPYNQQALSDADEDLGSGGGVIVPAQPGSPYGQEYIAAGKEGVIYVVNLAPGQMGQFNATYDNVIQEVNIGNGVFSSPAYFNSAIYYQAVGDVLKKYTLTDGLLSAAPSAETSVAYPYPGATPSISSNGTANGIVWDIEYAPQAILHAYDANSLTELYNSNQAGTRDQLGTGVKFAVPTVANGEVFVGGSGFLSVFGLLSPPTAPPAAPTSFTVSAPSSTNVNLSWVNNSLQQTGVVIERSTDGVNYTQIGLASADVTTYSDETVTPNTTYYYEIYAINTIGNSSVVGPVSLTTPSGTIASDVYHFDAGTGTTVLDSAGTNTGTLVGSPLPQWVTPGEQGTAALSFSGDGIYNQSASESAVKVTNDLSPILGSTSTLDFWVNTTQTGNNVHWEAPAVTGVEQTYGGNDINWGTLNLAGQIGIWVGDSGGIYSTNPINNGQWHNIAITRDATTGIVQLFVDGVLNGTATLDTGAKTSQFFLIGALSVVAQDGHTYTGANYFNGKLDEVQIYPTVLGINSILALAEVPAPPVLTSVTVATGPVGALAFTVPSAYTQSIEIDRMNGSSGTWAPLVTLPATATSYDDTTIVAGNTYSYQVKAIDSVGSSVPSNSISISPPLPSVLANRIFYNNSTFDGQNGSSNLTDDNAIATDKVALLPGQTASFANITSYSKGINGIMIDVANLTYLPRPDDFVFRVGNSSDTSNWTAAPTPTYFNDYPGRGPDGSTQITIIWNDNAIENEWLQVVLLAQPHLDLAANDVFYFGNEIGFTGSNSSTGIVTATDAANVTANESSSANVTNLYDINRDGVVNASDVAIVTAAEGTPPLNFITAAQYTPGVPTTPTGVTATASVGSISLSWNASTYATSYNIYRGNTSGGELTTPLATGITGTSYLDSNLSTGSYYYYVTASNANLPSPGNVSLASTEASATVSMVKLTGTPIGTATSWSNSGDTITQVFDGNLGTFYDAPDGTLTQWVGLDLGSPQTITQIQYAPRVGYEFRMVNGQFQASNSANFSSGVVNLYTITTAPTSGVMTAISVNPGGTYRYVRYCGGTQWVNIAEMEVDGVYTPPPVYTKIPGTPIGTPGSYANSGATVANVFDGNFATFFDPPDGTMTDWAGLDMGVAQTIAIIKYAPRSGYAYRMVGGQFQVSNSANFSSGVVTLYTITTAPVVGQFTTINVSPGGAYRYVRYVGGTQYVNIAEMEVDGIYTAPPPSVQLTGTVIGTAGSWANDGNTIAKVFDGNLSTYFDAPDGNLTDWAGLDLGATHNITTIEFAPRSGYEYRMVGGQFQVSNSANFSTGVVTVFTISAQPVAGQLTSISVSAPGYRYIRYVGGNSWVNIAEMEVFGN